MKRLADKLTFGLAVCALLAPIIGSAQESTPFFPFTDDFQDGSASDDAPVSYITSAFPATITIVNHDMVLTGPFQLAGFSLGLTVVQKSGKDVSSDDVSAQAVVRVSDPATYAGIFMRGQALAPDGDGGAYFGNIRGDGVIMTGSFTGQQKTLQTPLNPVTNDVVLRVESVGAQVIATAWAAEDPSRKYSLTFVDAVARPPGIMGQSFGRVGPDATGASATFRSLELVHGVAPPSLKIERAMILSWPMAAEGYALAGASNINGPWAVIDVEVRVQGGESTVALPANTQAQFYQLIRR